VDSAITDQATDTARASAFVTGYATASGMAASCMDEAKALAMATDKDTVSVTVTGMENKTMRETIPEWASKTSNGNGYGSGHGPGYGFGDYGSGGFYGNDFVYWGNRDGSRYGGHGDRYGSGCGKENDE